MRTDRKIIVYIATSADGYIARSDGNVDWLNRTQTGDDYGMGEFFKSIDTVLWGRKTYEPLLQKFLARKPKTSTRSSSNRKSSPSKIKNYVFTHNPPDRTPPGVEFVSGSVSQFAQRLRSEPGKDIWMMGGGGVIASFLDEGEIDEFMIHVVPLFIGEGIPLVQPRHRTVELELLSTKSWPDGLVRLHYAVQRSTAQQTDKKGGRGRNSAKRSKQPG